MRLRDQTSRILILVNTDDLKSGPTYLDKFFLLFERFGNLPLNGIARFFAPMVSLGLKSVRVCAHVCKLPFVP